MAGGRIGELSRALAGLPANAAQLGLRRHAKPVAILAHVITQPLQYLPLRTGGLVFRDERGDQFHVRAQMCHHGHMPALAAEFFVLGGQIPHVGHHLAGPPLPALFTIAQAGDEQTAFGDIGRSDPTDQWEQQDGALMGSPPQSESVFFVADKPATLAGFKGATAERGAPGRVAAGFFFLKPLQAAGKSVASISAVAPSQSIAVWMNEASSVSLICRKPITPNRSRKALRMRTSGTSCRCRKRAKARQAGCSESRTTSKLTECTGVSNAKRWTRHSWAALNRQRGPRAGRRFQRSLIKSSGMYGSSNRSNWPVPVSGSAFIGTNATP